MNNSLKNINWNGRTFGFDLLMINDQDRNQFYQSALGDVTGKTVLDIGAGTGLLSVLAVQQGAKKVYSFERDTGNYAIAKEFIQQSGLSDRIELVCADLLNVDCISWPHDVIDVTITETFANDCFIENFAFLVEHVEKHFNLSDQHCWIPERIDLNLDLVDVNHCTEFNPGVALPEEYCAQIENAIRIYRDHLYHKFEHNINVPVAQIPPTSLDQLTLVDNFLVDHSLKGLLEQATYFINFDHLATKNPYIKVEWVLYSGTTQIKINQASSWRNIAFKVDKNKSNKFYFRFNPLTHALICSQL